MFAYVVAFGWFVFILLYYLWFGGLLLLFWWFWFCLVLDLCCLFGGVWLGRFGDCLLWLLIVLFASVGCVCYFGICCLVTLLCDLLLDVSDLIVCLIVWCLFADCLFVLICCGLICCICECLLVLPLLFCFVICFVVVVGFIVFPYVGFRLFGDFVALVFAWFL